jgi:hypothetical protein
MTLLIARISWLGSLCRNMMSFCGVLPPRSNNCGSHVLPFRVCILWSIAYSTIYQLCVHGNPGTTKLPFRRFSLSLNRWTHTRHRTTFFVTGAHDGTFVTHAYQTHQVRCSFAPWRDVTRQPHRWAAWAAPFVFGWLRAGCSLLRNRMHSCLIVQRKW